MLCSPTTPDAKRIRGLHICCFETVHAVVSSPHGKAAEQATLVFPLGFRHPRVVAVQVSFLSRWARGRNVNSNRTTHLFLLRSVLEEESIARAGAFVVVVPHAELRQARVAGTVFAVRRRHRSPRLGNVSAVGDGPRRCVSNWYPTLRRRIAGRVHVW